MHRSLSTRSSIPNKWMFFQYHTALISSFSDVVIAIVCVVRKRAELQAGEMYTAWSTRRHHQQSASKLFCKFFSYAWYLILAHLHLRFPYKQYGVIVYFTQSSLEYDGWLHSQWRRQLLYGQLILPPENLKFSYALGEGEIATDFHSHKVLSQFIVLLHANTAIMIYPEWLVLSIV